VNVHLVIPGEGQPRINAPRICNIDVPTPAAPFYDKDTIEFYKTYTLGKGAWLLGKMKPLPSFFRVHWRVLNVDGFHYTLRFEPVKYEWSMNAKRSEERFSVDVNAGEVSGEQGERSEAS
jgi:hypothetical protein